MSDVRSKLRRGMASDPLSSVGPAVKACIVAGVRGVAPTVLSDRVLARELPDIVGEGLAPLALNLMDDSEQAAHFVGARLVHATMTQQLRSLAAEAALAPVLDVLGGAGVPCVVIKGPAVARFHPAGWPRTYSDIDLLVDPRLFRRATDRLLERGFKYPLTSLPPWSLFDRYCREGLNLHGAGPVDIHHHLAPWVFGSRLRSGAVLRAADCVMVRGRPVLMASPEHSAVIAALHILNDLWKGRRGLTSWRDLIVVLRATEVDGVRTAFESSGLAWLFNLLVSTVRRHIPGALDDVPCASLRIPSRVAWRVRGLGWDRSSALSRHRLAWAIRLPLPQASAFVLGSAFPSRPYIRARHGTYLGYWRQAWAETLSTFGGADHRMEKITRDGRSAA